jgi:hypothetical protein
MPARLWQVVLLDNTGSEVEKLILGVALDAGADIGPFAATCFFAAVIGDPERVAHLGPVVRLDGGTERSTSSPTTLRRVAGRSAAVRGPAGSGAAGGSPVRAEPGMTRTIS